MKKSGARVTRQELSWILYDVGNSAFTLLATTILPIWFGNLIEAGGLPKDKTMIYWGYAASLCTLIVAFIGPIFGAASDSNGRKKKLFVIFVLLGVVASLLMAFPLTWFSFILIFILAKIAYSASLVIYDSMLTDVTSPERMDAVSSHGYAWGYIGSVIPFIASLFIMLKAEALGLAGATAFALVMLINTAWWLLFTLPLLKNYQQKYYLSEQKANIAEVFRRLAETLREIKKHKKILFYLIAFFCYIDGVYTIIDMAVAYGDSVGLNEQALLLALLLTQFVAFPCAIIFARLSKVLATERLIRICIVAYGLIATFAIQLDKEWEFWLLAVGVGMFQGAIQALSRSYYAKIIPPTRSGEFFGIYDICGKGAAFIGTFLISLIVHVTGGNRSLGISVLVVMFAAGYVFFRKADSIK